MLEYLTDEKGNLKAVVDFWIVDKDGKLNDKGIYIWVNDFYVSPDCRRNGVINHFVQRIIQRVPWAKWGYFARAKYNDRLRIYSKRRWLKLIKKEE